MSAAKFTVSAGVLIAAVIAMIVFGECRYRAGAADQQLKAAGDSSDRRVARLVAEVSLLEARVRRDSARHADSLAAATDASAAAIARADSLERALKARGPVAADVQQVIDAFRATIAALEKENAEKDRTILFWQTTAAARGAQRDSALTEAAELRQQRDAWQKRARPACGPQATAGYTLLGRQLDATLGFGCRIALPRLPF